MSDEKWQKVRTAFDAALQVASAERQDFVRKICGYDRELLNEVESLLASSDESDSFLETPAIGQFESLDEQKTEPLGNSKSFNHYQIIRLIGMGGMGEVYLAEDKKLNRNVAIKILNENFARHESNLRRFIKEAQSASALNHPNILVIHEIGEAGGVNFIVSEYVEGRTLREIIREKRPDLKDMLEIAVQAAVALKAAHAAQLVHRDIKPENIMVRPDGLVKILDFGLAKLIEQQNKQVLGLDEQIIKQNETAKGIILGTVNYMSPEQAKGEPVDERSDIFSFGVVLYEMITGQSPFAAASISETFANLINKEPEPPVDFAGNIPPELNEIVLKALVKNKDERYQTMAELLADLRELKENLRFAEKLERNTGHGKPENAVTTVQLSNNNPGQSAENINSNPTGKIERQRTATPMVIAIFAAALLLFTGSYFVFYGRKNSITSVHDVKSVMVLPLKNVGSDKSDEYLSDGITDELTSRLTKLKNIRVVSPSAAMRYKNSPEEAARIGREMNVEAVIEGTVRKQADKFRVSLHLVNSADGFELWSDSDFESDINNLLDAQSQIAEMMASRLKIELTPQEKNLVAGESTNNPEAYELYLRGKEQFRKGELPIARELFDRAIQLDPNFADAYAWRGHNTYNQFKEGSGDRAAVDAALADANRALQLNPNLIAARRTLINIYHSTGQYEEGLKQGKLSLETNPDDFDAIEGAALAYFRAGMVDKSIPLYVRAVSADPTDMGMRGALARDYFYTGEYQKGIDVLSPVVTDNDVGTYWIRMLNYQGLHQLDQAIQIGKLGISRYPKADTLWLDYGRLLKVAGKSDEARAVWTQAAEIQEARVTSFENVRTRIWLGHFYAELGERKKALEQITRAAALEPNDAWTLYQIAIIHSVLNDRREAIDDLKQSIAHGWLGIHYLNDDSNPDNPAGPLAKLRDDPEFQQIRAALQQKVDELAKQY